MVRGAGRLQAGFPVAAGRRGGAGENRQLVRPGPCSPAVADRGRDRVDAAAVPEHGEGLPRLGRGGLDARLGWLGDGWFFAVTLAAALIPFAFAVFPSQDGPSHIGTSAILGRLWLDA